MVEDVYLVATEMRRLIERLGGQIVGPCKNAADALLTMKAERIDIALLDVNLDGTDAYDVADELRARGTPVIFATGYEPWAIDRRFSGTPHLEKPINEAKLVETIHGLGLAGAAGVP